MPDSTIMGAVNVQIQALRQEVQNGFSAVHERLDHIHDVSTDTAKWMGQEEQRSKAAHARIDEMKGEVAEVRKAANDASGAGPRAWALIIASIGTAIAALVKSLLPAKGG